MPAPTDSGGIERCPGCGIELPAADLIAQSEHLTAHHPEIVAERRAEAARWAGWECDV